MQNYNSTIKEIYDLQRFAIKLGLENITALCVELNHPQQSYPVIHIAGTNGKGSTAFFLAKILQTMGLRTGLFTSPHLFDFRERIRVNGRKISKGYIIAFWESIKELVLRRKATFFDTTTAMALDWFRQKQVDVAVIETGLGGRLDSTNIVKAAYTVITPIHFDHRKQLGDTLSRIAEEKAGIIKNGSAVFCAVQPAEALATIQKSLKKDNRFFYLTNHVDWRIKKSSWSGQRFDLFDHLHRLAYTDLKTRQLGAFQVDNIALAYLTACMYLKERRVLFDKANFRKMLQRSIWPGRLQIVSRRPYIILDVSHNLQGIGKTLSEVKKLCGPRRLHILAGLVNDKSYQSIARKLAEAADCITVTEPDTHRRLSATDLAEAFKKEGKSADVFQDIQEAFDFCKQSLNKEDTLLVIGSHYLIGPLLSSLN